jgi:hypothetical protein
MAQQAECPVCSGAEVLDVLWRENLPLTQNVVLATREQAMGSSRGSLVLGICRKCGFAYNRIFDLARLKYDANYDNDVPSPIFKDYYRELARTLAERYDLGGGTVYDVGCGKGTFLEILCEGIPSLTAIGIDPSCTPNEEKGLRLIRDVLSSRYFTEDPSLVICRHVLEHIVRPRDFAASLGHAIAGFPNVPLFFEVPDLNWILSNGAFWDFCYEHCNYFTPESLANTLSLAGFSPSAGGPCFAQQYQWISCKIAHKRIAIPLIPQESLIERATAYATAERNRIQEARACVEAAHREGPCVLWGMATKGVVFANLVDPQGELIEGGIDVNTRKQGKFIPGTGHCIQPPAWLTELSGTPTVFVMNRNYAAEIARMIDSLGSHAQLRVL